MRPRRSTGSQTSLRTVVGRRRPEDASGAVDEDRPDDEPELLEEDAPAEDEEAELLLPELDDELPDELEAVEEELELLPDDELELPLDELERTLDDELPTDDVLELGGLVELDAIGTSLLVGSVKPAHPTAKVAGALTSSRSRLRRLGSADRPAPTAAAVRRLFRSLPDM